MTAKAAKKTAKVKTLEKKAVTLTKAVTVKKNQGKVSYKNASAQAAAKKLKVNASKGTITVPKGTKKGTYSVKVKVTAKGNANYVSGSKTVTVHQAAKLRTGERCRRPSSTTSSTPVCSAFCSRRRRRARRLTAAFHHGIMYVQLPYIMNRGRNGHCNIGKDEQQQNGVPRGGRPQVPL